MQPKITVNGVDYESVDAMPPEVRKIYDDSMAIANRRGLGGLNVTLAENHTIRRGNDVKQTFVVNGKTYDDEASMPAEVREQYEKAMAALKAGGPNVTKNEIKLTFQVQGPHIRFGKSFGSSAPSLPANPSGPPSSMPSPIEPSSIESGIRMVLIVAACLGIALFWFLMRGH